MSVTDTLLRVGRERLDELVRLIGSVAVIPAFSGREGERAAFCHRWLLDAGIPARIDQARNVVWECGDCGGEVAVYVAHTDVVFPDETPLPLRQENGRLSAPGVGDNTANLAMLLLIMREIAQSGLVPARGGVVFACNSGEEGLGNLLGCRELMRAYAGRVRAFVSFDGPLGSMVNRAVGSRRYRVTVQTEGGHSYGNFGNRNAIACLCAMVETLYSYRVPENGRSTYNVGRIEGGTSVNSIAQHASMLFEFRSDDRRDLKIMQSWFDSVLEMERKRGLQIECEPLGERPCSGEVDPERQRALEERAAACQRALLGQIDVPAGSGSTDCNIPLSLGVPSVCFGGYRGKGAHTREEYIEIDSLKLGYPALLRMVLDDFRPGRGEAAARP